MQTESNISTSAPILSTPAEHILEQTVSTEAIPSTEQLSDEELYVQYEIRRTVSEIHAGRWRRVALQFPDDMLPDAPRVYDRLRRDLRTSATHRPDQGSAANAQEEGTSSEGHPRKDVSLCILADTSYGACCVDEVAAEHVGADVVVHYGRACLSPTARLPVIYVYTSRPLNLDDAVTEFQKIYANKDEKVCLLADIPYSHHVKQLHEQLVSRGYTTIFPTDIVRDPSSLLPNRTVPPESQCQTTGLQDYSIFHIATPPTSLLLTLSSRVKRVDIFQPQSERTGPANTTQALSAQLLRRRYALITKLASVPIFGILINTLSVSNYMQALKHCQSIISRAGKKSYVFVVGKVNAAKVANFSEIGGWVVIGCWESSLIESRDFYRPIITPFELEVALTDDASRTWGSEWISDFSSVLDRSTAQDSANATTETSGDHDASHNWDDNSDDEPPEFDLRTGRYVSHSRPTAASSRIGSSLTKNGNNPHEATSGSALVSRNKGEITINGTVSPGAEYLRSQRTWQGLGSEHEIAYERDETGKIRGATMEEGRSGVAKGYTVGRDDGKS